jgi:hypothetical protein
VGFHRLTTPVYAGGLRVGDDYINNAGGGTPAPADTVLAGGTYVGSYFFADGQVTTAAINRAHKALAANDDFLDDAIVQLDLDIAAAIAAYIAADVVVTNAFIAADTVQNVALANTAPAGDLLIGSAAKPVSFTGAPFSLALGTVSSQLTALLAKVNDDERIRVVTTNVTVDGAGFRDKTIIVDLGCTAITLPNPTTNKGRAIRIACDSDANDLSINLVRNAAEKINGVAASFFLPDGFAVTVVSDGTDWYVFQGERRNLHWEVQAYASAESAVPVDNEVFEVDTTGGVSSIALPPLAHPHLGRRIYIKDIGGMLSTNPLTLLRNGGIGTIEGVAANFVYDADYGSLTLWASATGWWFLSS